MFIGFNILELGAFYGIFLVVFVLACVFLAAKRFFGGNRELSNGDYILIILFAYSLILYTQVSEALSEFGFFINNVGSAFDYYGGTSATLVEYRSLREATDFYSLILIVGIVFAGLAIKREIKANGMSFKSGGKK